MSNWVTNTVMKFIALYVPKRGKRIIHYVLSFISQHYTEDDNVLIEEIMIANRKLKFTTDRGSIIFIVKLKEILLANETFQYILEDKVSDVVAKMPKWLKYDEDEKILKDTELVHHYAIHSL